MKDDKKAASKKKAAKKQKRKNIYTAMKEAATASPHKDTGNNNLYTALGLKPKKETPKKKRKSAPKTKLPAPKRPTPKRIIKNEYGTIE